MICYSTQTSPGIPASVGYREAFPLGSTCLVGLFIAWRLRPRKMANADGDQAIFVIATTSEFWFTIEYLLYNDTMSNVTWWEVR